MTEQERQRLMHLARGLRIFAQQVEAMCIPEHYAALHAQVAQNGDPASESIKEIQQVLQKEEAAR